MSGFPVIFQPHAPGKEGQKPFLVAKWAAPMASEERRSSINLSASEASLSTVIWSSATLLAAFSVADLSLVISLYEKSQSSLPNCSKSQIPDINDARLSRILVWPEVGSFIIQSE